MDKERKNIRKTHLIQLALILVVIVLLNVIGSFIFTRFDLTSEKRFTLSKATRGILNELDDYVYFRVYLEGDFPAGFKNLRRETKEMLDEFRAYSKYVDYEFINPAIGNTAAERNQNYQILADRGLKPTDLQVRTNEGTEQKIIFPGALVNYRDKEIAVDLLDNQLNMPPEASLNASVQNLEFKFADVLQKMTRLQKPAIAFIEGHGELSEADVFDITQSLQDNYRVERITIDGNISALTRRSEPDNHGEIRVLPNYDAIVIAKPTKKFDEKDKFIVDQYIMYGGKILWLIDPVQASMDSLQATESTVAVDLDLNLDDQLFTYGVRLNKNLILDLNSAAIPLRTGQVGGQAQIEFYRWFYFPLLNAASEHPLARNLNAVKATFVSSIDTAMTGGIKKTPLLKTSNYSRISGMPALVTLAMLREEPDQRMFNRSGQNVAYLLEGSFSSLFANRMPPEILESKEISFVDQSKKTSMIVVADGDIIQNQFHVPKGYPLPLGYDQYTRQTYGNKDFVLNAISFLAIGDGLIGIRSRDIKIRLLDNSLINRTRLNWQLINTLLPVLVVVVFGLLLTFYRRKRYSR